MKSIIKKYGCFSLCSILILLLFAACSNDNSKVTGISLSEKQITVLTDGEGEIIASIEPAELKNIALSWESSDETIIAVDGEKKAVDGSATAILKPVGVGTAEITATTKNDYTATCKVIVRDPVEVESITLLQSNITIPIGVERSLSATVNPSNADYKDIEWSSTNRSVATVSDGNIVACAVGTTTIIAKTQNGVSAKCSLTVREPIEIESIALAKEETTIILGDTEVLDYDIQPPDADNRVVEWTSSDESIAKVNGGRVQAVAEGSAIITATTVNGKQAQCVVNARELTGELLDSLLKEQPLYVSSTKYLVQSDRWKTLYPDMLNGVVTNAGDDTIKSAVVSFVAWDSNNLPVKIVTQSDYIASNARYEVKVNYGDINLLPGQSYGQDKGLELSEYGPDIATFKACVISYETFDGKTWENPYYDKFIDMYENKVLQ